MSDINSAIARVDRAWQLEYQQTAEEQRYRIVDAPPEAVLRAAGQALLDMGLALQPRLSSASALVAENNAPAPLTREEWADVVRREADRAKAVGGWFVRLDEDPRDYVIQLRATVQPAGDGALIFLEYGMDNPALRAKGVLPSKHAPPSAVALASARFWTLLERRLAVSSGGKPRKRLEWEKSA